MSDRKDAIAVLNRLNLPRGFKPTWELLSLFPQQGTWTEHAYLDLAKLSETERFVELVDGRLEILPMPTQAHQLINGLLYRLLFEFVAARGLGIVLFAGMRVRMPDANFRMPDVVYLSKKNRDKATEEFWKSADLAMEVVSEDDPDRDYVEKRREYAKAGIREYWIVDPRDRSVTLLLLRGRKYVAAGTYRDGDNVESRILSGFSIPVTGIFDAAKA